MFISTEKGIDFIGDLQGCLWLLYELLEKLGYAKREDGLYVHPEGRKPAFAGDIVDRGPQNADTLYFVYRMCSSELAYCLLGNHDVRIRNKLNGKNVVTKSLGYAVSWREIQEKLSHEFENMRNWMNTLPAYIIFNDKILFTHAGLTSRSMLKLPKRDLEDKCIYGVKEGRDADGYRIIKQAASCWDAPDLLQIHGHIKHKNAVEKINNVINIDTNPEHEGWLSCWRFPEEVVVQSSQSTWNWDVEKYKFPEYNNKDIVAND